MYKRNMGYLTITLGILILIYSGLNSAEVEKVAENNVIKIIKVQTKTFRWSPVFGGFLIVGGIAIIMMSNSKQGNIY
jgi:hypothetical protein